LSDIDSPIFRSEVVEFLEGVAAQEGIIADAQAVCERAGWSIRAALAMLDMQERQATELESITVDETKMAAIQPAPRKPVSEKKPRLQSAAQRVTVPATAPAQESATGPAEKLAKKITTEFGIAPAVSSSIMELVAGSIMEWVLNHYDVRPKN
jgi:hypothetical protein